MSDKSQTLPIELDGMDHIAIAVPKIEEALETYLALGFKLLCYEEVEDQGVRTAMLDSGREHVELMEPLREDSPVGKFLANRGSGIHHVCYRVKDLEGALKHLDSLGYRLIDKTPRIGVGGARIAFIHPKTTFGALIELKELKQN